MYLRYKYVYKPHIIRVEGDWYCYLPEIVEGVKWGAYGANPLDAYKKFSNVFQAETGLPLGLMEYDNDSVGQA